MEYEYYTDQYEDEEVLEKEGDFPIIGSDGQDALYFTDTKGYDPTKFDIVSPEQVEEENRREEISNPNPEFSEAINELEKKFNRKLTEKEFLKAADTYATILAERDEEKKAKLEGKYEINPIKKELYFKMILEKEPLTNAFAITMKNYEDQIIEPIIDEMEKVKNNKLKVIEMKRNDPVNLHFDGKCRIASDEGGKVIIIDNKNDVNLLQMKYRKEWIDKKYPDEVKLKTPISEDDDEFV
jgi:hypothetical protein